jgi:hypothetical protein
MNALLVGGNFDHDKGKSSKIFEAISKSFISSWVRNEHDFCYINGGNLSKLSEMAEKINKFNVAIWFPNISNDEEKIIAELKKRNKKLLLVASKNNTQNKYNISQLLQHALKNKANIFVEFTRNDGRYSAKLLDPLGNQYGETTENMNEIGERIASRVMELLQFTRIGSKNVGPVIEAPNDTSFFEVIRKHAETFHELIYGDVEISRFLGNSSFRCTNGFPSMKNHKGIFVTKRNLDKSLLNQNGFVCVENNEAPVLYHGENKPSVDTPIQIRLYNYYDNLRYILHSHCYIEGALMTNRVIPCGAIEEFDEIIALYSDSQTVNICVNLKGHGSLVLADNVEYMKNIKYIARKFPELLSGG